MPSLCYLAGKKIVDKLSGYYLNNRGIQITIIKNRPFVYQTTFDHLNIRLVWYSDPYCDTLYSTYVIWALGEVTFNYATY